MTTATTYRRTQRPRQDPNHVLGEYIPPQDIEAEQSTLGAMLIERQAIDAARCILTQPDDFYREAHKTLYAAILRIADRNEVVDFITVQAELKTQEQLEAIGGVSYLAILYNRVPTAVNAEYYARIVEEKARRRRYIAAALEIIGVARGATDSEELDKSLSAIVKMLDTGQFKASDSEQLGVASMRLYDEIAERVEAQRSGEVRTLPEIAYPFRELQEWTGGMRDGQLIVVAGRPSMGKTSFALKLLLEAAFAGKKVLFVSLETGIDTIVQRCVCMIAMLSPSQLRNAGDMEEAHRTAWYNEAVVRFMALDFEIWEPADCKPSQLASKLREMDRKGQKPDLVAIDYVQLMRPDEKSGRSDDSTRTLELHRIISSIKSLAREFKFPLIALAQVKQDVDKRDNKRPRISDISETDACAKDGDVIVLLYREAYYAHKAGMKIDPKEYHDVDLIVDKNKEGPTGTTRVFWRPECGNWQDDDSNEQSLVLTAPAEPKALPSGRQYWHDRDEPEDPI